MSAEVQQTRALTYSIREAAKALSISERTVTRLITDQRLPSCKIGRRLVPVAALEKWVASHQTGGHDASGTRPVAPNGKEDFTCASTGARILPFTTSLSASAADELGALLGAKPKKKPAR